MATFLSPCDRFEILRRIECVCLELRSQSITEEASKQPLSPHDKIQFGGSQNLTLNVEHPFLQHTRVITMDPRQKITVAHIVRVLQTIHDSILHNTNITLRALYYQNRDIFLDQTDSNLSVSLCSQLLRVRRPLLCVFATGKGVVWGPVQLLDSAGVGLGSAHTTRSPHGLRISDGISFVRGLNFVALRRPIQFILVVEKESAFNKIVEEILQQQKLGSQLAPFVMVSGNGMPSLATRELVRLLHAHLKVPVFGMFDCNPDGVGVMLSYLYTSNASINSLGWVGKRNDYTIPSMNWLGITTHHVELEAQHRGLHVKDAEQIASGTHTERDTSRFRTLLSHPLIVDNKRMKKQLNTMWKR